MGSQSGPHTSASKTARRDMICCMLVYYSLAKEFNYCGFMSTRLRALSICRAGRRRSGMRQSQSNRRCCRRRHLQSSWHRWGRCRHPGLNCCRCFQLKRHVPTQWNEDRCSRRRRRRRWWRGTHARDPRRSWDGPDYRWHPRWRGRAVARITAALTARVPRIMRLWPSRRICITLHL